MIMNEKQSGHKHKANASGNVVATTKMPNNEIHEGHKHNPDAGGDEVAATKKLKNESHRRHTVRVWP